MEVEQIHESQRRPDETASAIEEDSKPMEEDDGPSMEAQLGIGELACNDLGIDESKEEDSTMNNDNESDIDQNTSKKRQIKSIFLDIYFCI